MQQKVDFGSTTDLNAKYWSDITATYLLDITATYLSKITASYLSDITTKYFFGYNRHIPWPKFDKYWTTDIHDLTPDFFVFFCIGAIICTRQEIQFLPYTRFFSLLFFVFLFLTQLFWRQSSEGPGMLLLAVQFI